MITARYRLSTVRISHIFLARTFSNCYAGNRVLVFGRMPLYGLWPDSSRSVAASPRMAAPMCMVLVEARKCQYNVPRIPVPGSSQTAILDCVQRRSWFQTTRTCNVCPRIHPRTHGNGDATFPALIDKSSLQSGKLPARSSVV